MNFYIDREKFLHGLKKICGVSEKNTIVPITSNVLLDVKKGEIIASATNFEVGIIIKNSTRIIEEGKTLIDAQKTHEIIKSMPRGEVHIIKKDSGWVEISDDKKIEFNIAGMPVDEFPVIKTERAAKPSKVRAGTIHRLIKNTVYAASIDRSRDVLRGVLVEKKEGVLRMVATDGHRLALADSRIYKDEKIEIDKKVVVPQKGAQEIKRLAEEMGGEEKLQIGFGEKSVVVEGGGEMLVVRLIEGEFPNYERVIPQNNKNRVILNKRELLEALQRVTVMSDEETRAVKMVVKAGKLTISSKKIGLGDAKEEVGAEYGGEDIEVGLNSRYVFDVINTIGEDDIILEVLDGVKPVLIRAKDREDIKAVIMPVMP